MSQQDEILCGRLLAARYLYLYLLYLTLPKVVTTDFTLFQLWP